MSEAGCGTTMLIFRANDHVAEFESPQGCSEVPDGSEQLEYNAVREDLFEVAQQLRVL